MKKIYSNLRMILSQRLTRADVIRLTFIMLLAMIMSLLVNYRTNAATLNPTATAKISFTFDDGLTSVRSQAQPTLTKYGLVGTSYVITKCVGMTTAPNTCRADNDARYMSWAQIKQVQAAGWEIGSHTLTHPYLATSDAGDGQPNVLTPAQVTQELTQSKADFAAQGIAANAFSTPYGDYNPATLSQIAKLYSSHRGFADRNNNIWPYNDYLINNMPVQAGVTVAQVKAKIDAAIANKQWLVLTMHDIKVTPSTNPDDYQYSTRNLDQIAAYVKTKQTAGLIKSVTVSQGLVSGDTNLLPGSGFDGGIVSGWTTDTPTGITADTAGNGSIPGSANSVKLTSSANAAHLFSPQVVVDPNTTYIMKNFLKINTIASGELGFYIDEYDGSGNWISGQYKNGERTAFVEAFNFTYKPTSPGVKKARLQVIVPANSGIVAYIDNPQWLAASTTLPPVQTNLIPNGTFDNGIAIGWTTDDAANITADSGNHGSPSNPVSSVALKSTTKSIHLFSPKVGVDATKTYSLASYLNLQQITSGEVGFYVDEYDTAGAWISGRYISSISGISAGDVSFQYKPSSSNVRTASLQVIVPANSGISAYFDDVRWY